jgi:site-specific recombinase XerD
LRHTAATHVRKEFGLEAAKCLLGHSELKTAEIYAEADLGKARDVMAAIG